MIVHTWRYGIGAGCGGNRSAVDQQFRDLYGVERGPFSDLIAHDPESQGIVNRHVHAHAPYVAGISVGAVQRGGPHALRWVVHQGDSGFAFIGAAGSFQVHRFFKMGTVNGHAHAGACYLEFGQGKNFTAFIKHLKLFLGIAVFRKGIDLGKKIEGYLVGINIFHYGMAVHYGAHLGFQFRNAVLAAAGNRLITGGDDGF